jgi:hypothetical protein
VTLSGLASRDKFLSLAGHSATVEHYETLRLPWDHVLQVVTTCYNVVTIASRSVAGEGRMLVGVSTRNIFGRLPALSGASTKPKNRLIRGLGLLLQPLRPYCTYAETGTLHAFGGAATRTGAPQ